MPKTVVCPNCGKPVPWKPESRWRPFCSERCRLIDLGEWFDEGHRITEPIDEGHAAPSRPEEDEGYH
ncbi:MAG: DNA gyrase inhibitor YacG [Gammaproteobacteria bacterium]